MELDKLIKKFFSNNKENILDRSKVDSEKLFKIKFKDNELNISLPYMGNIYVVDNEGYFRGVITLGGYNRNPNAPHFILDNIGRVRLWYEDRPDSDKFRLWKKDTNTGIDFSQNGQIPLSEGIKYLLENTEQIKEPDYKITI